MIKGFQLKAVRSESISFVNKVQANTALKLGFKYKHNLRYTAPGIARAEMTVTAEDKEHPENFSISVTEIGIFAIPEGIGREEAHIESFNYLFPYTAAVISSVTSSAGVPAVIVPRIDIDEQNIYRFDFRPPKPDGE